MDDPGVDSVNHAPGADATASNRLWSMPARHDDLEAEGNEEGEGRETLTSCGDSVNPLLDQRHLAAVLFLQPVAENTTTTTTTTTTTKQPRMLMRVRTEPVSFIPGNDEFPYGGLHSRKWDSFFLFSWKNDS